MTNVYLVNWMGGTSGAFVAALLNQFILEPLQNEEIEFSQYGDSHGVSDRYQKNHKVIENTGHIAHVTPIYKSVEPYDVTQPFVMIDHAEPNYDELFALYPTCKNIVVTVPEKMLYRARGNMYFKNRCQAYYLYPERWYEYRESFDYLRNLENPNDIDPATAEYHIKNHGINLYHENAFFHDDSTVPEAHKDKIFRVSFYDIIHNHEVVLNQLSSATGKPILDGHRNFYQKYIDKQNELISTKMPWLNDS